MDFLTSVGRRESVTVNETGRWVELGNKSLNGYERNVLYSNRGSTPTPLGPVPAFVDTAFLEGVDLIDDGRACAYTDLEGDGDLDLVVQNFARPVRVLVQAGEPGPDRNWLRVRLRGPAGNVDALGARIVATLPDGRRILREVSATGGYLAGQSKTMHLGLGPHTEIERLEIFWPKRGTRVERTVLHDVAANRELTVDLAEATALDATPPE